MSMHLSVNLIKFMQPVYEKVRFVWAFFFFPAVQVLMFCLTPIKACRKRCGHLMCYLNTALSL